VLLLRAKRLSCRNWPTTALMVPENLLEPRFSACNVVRRLMVVHGIKPESLLALSDSVWMAVMLVIDDGMPPTRLLPSKILRQRARERTRSKTEEDIYRVQLVDGIQLPKRTRQNSSEVIVRKRAVMPPRR